MTSHRRSGRLREQVFYGERDHVKDDEEDKLAEISNDSAEHTNKNKKRHPISEAGSSRCKDDSNPSRRVSSRSNKFSQSLKEPNSESLRDLLVSSTKKSPPSTTSANELKKADVFNLDSDAEDSDSVKDQEHTGGNNRKKRSSPQSELTRYSAVPSTRKLRKVSLGTPKKSPAVRHSRLRRRIATEVPVPDENSSDSDQAITNHANHHPDSDTDTEDDIKIQRIIACRSDTLKSWRDRCSLINSSEIENGSRWFQDDDIERNTDELQIQERFLVKWSGLSYLHCSWETEKDLIDQVDNAKTYIRFFFRKSKIGFLFNTDERGDGEFFDPRYTQIERILEVRIPEIQKCDSRFGKKRKVNFGSEDNWGLIFDKRSPDYNYGTGREFLIKWGETPYSELSYEYERDLIMNQVEFDDQLESFYQRSRKPDKATVMSNFQKRETEARRLYKLFGDSSKKSETQIEEFKKDLERNMFPNGGQLRDYQAEGVSWLLANYVNKRNSILADEMGLGKTIQTTVFVHMLSTVLRISGPFLVIAPLSTIPHWYREFASWTNLNTIVYHGSSKDREFIRETEFAYECDRPHNIGFNQSFLSLCHNKVSPNRHKTWMVQVVLTTPEMLCADDHSELGRLEWELLIVDEAHRLKNHSSKLANCLRDDRFVFRHSLLLTGTPIQNNMNELWTLLNMVNPNLFADCNDFMSNYGDMKSKDKVDELHENIRPYILRRLKEDVEKSVPPKEETLIEVELTVLQKQYYRALYEKNVQFLHRNAKKALDGPSLNNIVMQLRKCCNHPYLLKGVEAETRTAQNIIFSDNNAEADFLVKASGKLVLLDKLLPKLKEGGHRVLIFSQFKIMLDILQDYLRLRRFKAERIDGSITGRQRQMAIDRFQAMGSMDTSFIMLLTTRAGGVGINLTAADTCIIYDSDWNPQNDLQAQARCHRIGQTKSVKVYRLLTRKSYEMQMFHMSSLKMGLDQAVLQGLENGKGENIMSKEEVEKLLRHGAYDIFQEEKGGLSEKESNQFIEEDIDTILQRRTRTVVHDNNHNIGIASGTSGSTFSKASFKASRMPCADGEKGAETDDIDVDDPDFWRKVVGIAPSEPTDKPISRKRSVQASNYDEKLFNNVFDSHFTGSDSSENDDLDYSDESSASSIYSDGEIAFNDDVPLKNEYLCRMRDQGKIGEKTKWGGDANCHWKRKDALLILEYLQRYGYINDYSDVFFDSLRRELSKSYDNNEIRRMFWALSFVAILESSECDVIEYTRRMGKRRITADSSFAQITTESSVEQAEEQKTENSFKKLWGSSSWVPRALNDAFAFAECNTERHLGTSKDQSSISVRSSLVQSFNSKIWVSLKNRGWLKEDSNLKTQKGKKGKSQVKQYVYNAKIYRSISEVLDVIPELHPELGAMVQQIISSAYRPDQESLNKSSSSKNLEHLPRESITGSYLRNFIYAYAPLQLIADRSRSSRISIPRKVVDIMTYMHHAHLLMSKAQTREKDASDDSIGALINVSLKLALPCPSWTRGHDVNLVRAILQYGWIDHDDAFTAINNDKRYLWGPSVDDEVHKTSPNHTQSLSKSSKNIDAEELKVVANRVVAFLNTEDALLNELKGFNIHNLTTVYGIVETSSSEVNIGRWTFNEEALRNRISSSHQDCIINHCMDSARIPSRKDVVKRAKYILCKPADLTHQGHSFAVLDVDDPCNAYLLELFHAILRLGQGSGKVAKKLLDCALQDIDGRCRSGNVALKPILELIQNLIPQLKTVSRPLKNVLRVTLGLDPIAPKNANDPVFLCTQRTRSHVAQCNSASTLTIESKSASREVPNQPKHTPSYSVSRVGSLADAAISRGVAFWNNLIKKNEDAIQQDKLFRLTPIQVMLLGIVGSRGLPSFSTDTRTLFATSYHASNDRFLTWANMGIMLYYATEEWCRIAGETPQSPNNSNQSINDLNTRRIIREQATVLRQSPLHLAKKVVYLLGALQQQFMMNESTPLNGWMTYQLFEWTKIIETFDPSHFSAALNDWKEDKKTIAVLNMNDCRCVFSQCAQQTMLRSVLIKRTDCDLLNMLSAYKSGFWKREYDLMLLKGILELGYSNSYRVRDAILSHAFNDPMAQNQSWWNQISTWLTCANIQRRVSYLTFKLFSMENPESDPAAPKTRSGLIQATTSSNNFITGD